MEFKVLAIGDVVGNPGMERVRRKLRQLKRKTEADFVIVNGENASGTGLTPRQAEAVDVQKILRLFSSPLGKTLLSAKTLRREFKFSILTDAEAYSRARRTKGQRLHAPRRRPRLRRSEHRYHHGRAL